jgi:predicted nucleotidyltransferase
LRSTNQKKGNPLSIPKTLSGEQLVDVVIKVLAKDDRVIFAYLYGSIVSEGKGNDIDIAVFPVSRVATHSLAVDLKIDLHEETGVPPDTFDVRLIGDLVEKGDIFGLLYLRNVLDGGRILVDKDRDVRADFLERYGLKFRECEGLIQEVLA